MNKEEILKAERIFLRREIIPLNNKIKFICTSTNYPYDSAYIFIMKNFYGITEQDNKLIKSYNIKVSPINYFNAKALIQYKNYLKNIISTYESKSVAVNNYLDKKRIFIETIIKEAEKIREICKLKDSLPEDNDNAEKLERNITTSVLKKAAAVYKKSNIQVPYSINSIINKQEVNSKEKKLEKHQNNYNNLERKQLELTICKENLNDKYEDVKLQLQLEEYLDLDQIERNEEIRDIKFNLREVDEELKIVQKDMDKCTKKINAYKEEIKNLNVEFELIKK